jgi:hypothetical protein
MEHVQDIHLKYSVGSESIVYTPLVWSLYAARLTKSTMGARPVMVLVLDHLVMNFLLP